MRVDQIVNSAYNVYYVQGERVRHLTFPTHLNYPCQYLFVKIKLPSQEIQYKPILILTRDTSLTRYLVCSKVSIRL